MAHSHDHSHHGHAHGQHDHRHYVHAVTWQKASKTRFAFIAGAVLNIGFVIIEYIAGWWADSLALIADASHNLTDVMGLLIAFFAVHLASRLPSARFTYGMGGATILAALANGLLLMFIAGALALQAVDRIQNPLPVSEMPVIIVAAIGVLVNLSTAFFFHGHSHGDVNVRGVYIHMMGDAGVSLAVVVGGLAMMYGVGSWVDPLISLLIVLAIIVSTWGLLRESVDLAMQGVPKSVKLDEVREYLQNIPGVGAAHDLHVWALSTTETALTAHIIMPAGHPGDQFLDEVTKELAEKFGIVHATIQIETSPHHIGCALGGPMQPGTAEAEGHGHDHGHDHCDGHKH